MKSIAVALAATLALCACATSRVAPVRPAPEPPRSLEGEPAAVSGVKRICIVENPRVASDFLDSYTVALKEKGYAVEVIRKKAYSLTMCPVMSEYVAFWRWDLTYYLAHADLRIYRDGKPAGRAVFNARNSRFITTEGTVKDLVNKLFPN